VAVLMGELVRLVARGLPTIGYRITRADVDAEGLAWAGDDVDLRAEAVGVTATEMTFNCTASVGTRPIGRMQLGVSMK